MRSIVAFAILSLASSHSANAQGRPVDWSSYAGDAQRTGWEKSDSRITKDNVKDFQLVLKRKLESSQKGPESLTPPVVIGNLISYRGFKELAFVAGSENRVWSIDADMDRIFWQKQLGPAPAAKSTCPAGATAMPALTPPVNFGAGRGAPRPAGTPARPANAPVAFGAPRPIYVISSDGKLHRLNTSDGSDQAPPVDFIPPGSKASSLTLSDGYVYTTTSTACGGSSNAVWAIDLTATNPKPASFPLTGGAAAGAGGFAIGTDGTVYVQTGAGKMDVAANQFSGTLLALNGGDLKLKSYFTDSDSSGNASLRGTTRGTTSGTTPVVFAHEGRDLVVSSGGDGRLYLFDSKSVGEDDHKTPVFRTEPLSTPDHGIPDQGIGGGLASWQDADGVRWVLAPVWGPVNPELKVAATNGDAPHGSIVAFKVEDQNGKPALVPTWVSSDVVSPQAPVITSGVVFALSSGDKSVKGFNHATLFALDALTGKQMYSTGNQVTAPANLTGVSIANGRVFFTTTDNTLYGFGIFLER
jgi:hypothetical protein